VVRCAVLAGSRNPEDPKQTKSRAKQTAQLLKGLTDFAHAHDALDAPALMAGDLNTTNIRQIADIARTVFELCQQTAHPFLFTATPPRSLPTSVTTTRRMCIDCAPMHCAAPPTAHRPRMPQQQPPASQPARTATYAPRTHAHARTRTHARARARARTHEKY
jgi:hypothetical protein